jgi:nucleotide-binding universal stress UspA family protein
VPPGSVRSSEAPSPASAMLAGRDVPRDELAFVAALDHAHEHGFNLVVTGHHRDSRAGRLILRGVPETLLRTATVPVLVVTDPER